VGLFNKGIDVMIGLYMVTANRLELFKNAIKTLCDSTNMQFTGLILDNNSEPDVSRQIKGISLDNGFEYQKSHKQLGFAESFNHCIKYHLQNPEIEYFAHIHDDVVFKQYWLDNILNVMRHDHRVWCACPAIHSGGYDGLESFNNLPIPEVRQYPRYLFFENMNTACAVFTRSCFEVIGLYDEQFVLAGEDTDYYYRLLLVHRPQAEVLDSTVYHLRTGGIEENNDELIRRREERYKKTGALIRKKWQNVVLDYKTQWTFSSIESPLAFPLPKQEPIGNDILYANDEEGVLKEQIIERVIDRCLQINSYQNRREIVEFAKFVDSVRPSTIIEIGSYYGASTAILGNISTDNSEIICIDIDMSHFDKQRVEGLFDRGQKLYLIEGDSHSLEVKEKVSSILNGRKADILFIDGGHSYNEIYKDFVYHSKFVRDGGTIALHDIEVQIRQGTVKGRECYYGTDLFFDRLSRIYKSSKIAYPETYLPKERYEAAGIGYIEYDSKYDIDSAISSVNFVCYGDYELSLPDYIAVSTALVVHQCRPTLWTDGKIPKTRWYDKISKIADIITFDKKYLNTFESYWGINKMDYLRYCLMYDYGGLWLDLDTLCVKPFHSNFPLNKLVVGMQDENRCNGAIMYASNIQNEDVEKLRNRCIAKSDTTGGHGVLGPELITQYSIDEPTQDMIICPQEYFYKYNWKQFDKIYGDGELTNDVFVIHLWGSLKPTKDIITRELLEQDNYYTKALYSIFRKQEIMREIDEDSIN